MTAKELFNKMHPQDGDLPKWAEDLMELYAKEQYNQAIRDAAESAKMKFHDGFHKENKDIEHFQSGQDNLTVSKQSILKLLK